MRKVLLSIVAVFAFAAASNAQSVGVSIGANFANVGGDDVEETESKFNFTAGLFAEFMLSEKIGLQAELVSSGQGYKFDDPGGSGFELKQKLGYLNVPVMANIYLADNFYVQAGPYLGFLLSAEESISGSLGTTDTDNKDQFESTDFGAMLGLGVKAGKFNFGARYQLGLSDIVADASAKNRVFNVSAGFRFVNN